MGDVAQPRAAGLDIGGADLYEYIIGGLVQNLQGVGVLVLPDPSGPLLRGDEVERVQTVPVEDVCPGVHRACDLYGAVVPLLEELLASGQDLGESLSDRSETADEYPHLKHPSRRSCLCACIPRRGRRRACRGPPRSWSSRRSSPCASCSRWSWRSISHPPRPSWRWRTPC